MSNGNPFMGKTRIAVAGAGLIGQAHMRIAQASATVSLSAVVDPAPAAAALAAKAGVPLYTSLEELLARFGGFGPVVTASPAELRRVEGLGDAGIAAESL